MIAACPGCSARYRIEAGRLRPEGVRLRCSRCEAVFRVSPPPVAAQGAGVSPAGSTPPVPMPQPEASGEPAPSLPPPEASGEPAPSLPPPMSRPAPPDSPSPPVDRERLVLIADSEVEQGKSTASALAQWGFQPTLVHDGVEAMLAIQRLLPRAIVIDAALPKMFGFQVCEIIKRNESLCDIHVVLVGAVHDRTRYRRPPEEIYGADAYLERQELPESLRSILQGFGMLSSAGQSPAVPAAAVTPLTPPVAAPASTILPAVEANLEPEVLAAPESVETVSSAEPPAVQPTPKSAAPPAPASGDSETDEKVEQAERLARIVVSDIVLYSKEKFEAAVEAGNVLEAMQPEIAEGRSLFVARVDPSIQEIRDFLTEELLRVAEATGKP
ncbi:MAG: zinc-ribbon domain-containing protein [Myxococcales bacterium]|nr:zinc-ribbon domain-containing protein [Myxococcales bacterium]